jgi:alanine racemase
MTRPARARIDLQALQHNFRRVQQAAPHSKIIAIVKAHAYGHGLVRVAQALSAADAFGVACMEEAITLREAGCDRRIVLLEGLFSPADIMLINGYRLDVVIHSTRQVEMLEQGSLSKPLDIWLKIDTGMHRLGFRPTEAAAVADRLRGIPQVATLRFMTHFACADDLSSDVTLTQLRRFSEIPATGAAERSLANSAGVLGWPDAHCEWVRPGIMLYGSSPLAGQSAAALDLQPVMTLGTELIAVTARSKGDAVGYGGDWVCPRDMRIGVAAIGYGDGYPRHATSGMQVLVNDKPAALAGRVSMDMICIDLGDQPDARGGDEVVLWGPGLPVDQVAAQAGTISYELLCGVGSRVHFEYIP